MWTKSVEDTNRTATTAPILLESDTPRARRYDPAATTHTEVITDIMVQYDETDRRVGGILHSS